MRYELLIQPMTPGAPYDPRPLEELLMARGISIKPDGARMWVLPQGEVEVRRLAEGGQLVATELKVPLAERTDLVRSVVVEAAAIAQQLGLKLVDPQLAKQVGAADEGGVADSYLRVAKFAGQYAGVSEAVVASYGAAEPYGLKPGTKVLLGLIGFFVLLYLIADRLLGG